MWGLKLFLSHAYEASSVQAPVVSATFLRSTQQQVKFLVYGLNDLVVTPIGQSISTSHDIPRHIFEEHPVHRPNRLQGWKKKSCEFHCLRLSYGGCRRKFLVITVLYLLADTCDRELHHVNRY